MFSFNLICYTMYKAWKLLLVKNVLFTYIDWQILKRHENVTKKGIQKFKLREKLTRKNVQERYIWFLDSLKVLSLTTQERDTFKICRIFDHIYFPLTTWKSVDSKSKIKECEELNWTNSFRCKWNIKRENKTKKRFEGMLSSLQQDVKQKAWIKHPSWMTSVLKTRFHKSILLLQELELCFLWNINL